MNCERCHKRPATVHLMQVINNQKTEMNVCEYCAGELQQETWGFGSDFNLNNFLSGLMGCGYSPSLKKSGSVACPKCGSTDTKITKGGLFGCDQCYETFEEQILPLVKRIHGTMQHTGKVPKRTGGRARLEKDIRLLKAKLQEAVSKEEFEKAVKLRDKIRSLEQQLQ
ncbi:UvrB/UvrC motif-containing protein [Peptococcaceae bacterium 1198_IL3148]